MSDLDIPLKNISQDLLERDRFVERLTAALLTKDKQRASGTVIGLNGAWGSGKSSILNFVDQNLPNSAIVVRFNPWLISDRDDLIAHFFSELISALNRTREGRTSFDLLDMLPKYAALLAPATDAITGGWSELIRGPLAVLAGHISKGASLSSLYNRISRELSLIKFPIVVLIDELDRVEDREVRAVAQLVKAVAAFPNVSYLVAYDWHRVTEALGSDHKADTNRGQAYLEKIVQFQVDMPRIHKQKITEIFSLELSQILADGSESTLQVHEKRYIELVDYCIPDLISTPRDIKKTLGSYRALLGLMEGDIDQIDLLAYCILSEKAPLVISNLKNNLPYFTDLGGTARNFQIGFETDTYEEKDYFALLVPELERYAKFAVENVLRLLFPIISGGGQATGTSFPLSTRRGLGLVTGMGLPAGEISRREISAFVECPYEEKLSKLLEIEAQHKVEPFFDTVDDLYRSLTPEQARDFWLASAEFLCNTDSKPGGGYNFRYNLTVDLHTMFRARALNSRQQGYPIASLIFGMIDKGDASLTGAILRDEVLGHPLFSSSLADDRKPLMKLSDAKDVTRHALDTFRDSFESGELYSSLWSPQILFIYFEEMKLGGQPSGFKQITSQHLSSEKTVLLLCTLLFRPGHVVSRDVITEMYDIKKFAIECSDLLDTLAHTSTESYEYRSVSHALSVLGSS
ncbi:MAG: P-loop NTPase fold protein [Halieaceae bacterium]|jgi:hypothetical protein|nr:P-loop NTPase fold protein [Halieaceae bacterium]